MKIQKKNWIKQLYCKHEYQEGILHSDSPYVIISGKTYTTVCVKCGKIKGIRFVQYD